MRYAKVLGFIAKNYFCRGDMQCVRYVPLSDDCLLIEHSVKILVFEIKTADEFYRLFFCYFSSLF